jgi:hypothetical protein
MSHQVTKVTIIIADFSDNLKIFLGKGKGKDRIYSKESRQQPPGLWAR